MDFIFEWVIAHAQHAHWIVFISILLAGLSIPISLDFIVIVGALLAAHVVPENTYLIFLSVFLGCFFSAILAYWVGRIGGIKFSTLAWFNKVMPGTRLAKIRQFYEKHGFLTLLVGRFIPFGIRNAIFMGAGMSQAHFGKFMARDFIASFIWSLLAFYTFLHLGKNYQTLLNYTKISNMAIFGVFGITLTAFIWYKKRTKPFSRNS